MAAQAARGRAEAGRACRCRRRCRCGAGEAVGVGGIGGAVRAAGQFEDGLEGTVGAAVRSGALGGVGVAVGAEVAFGRAVGVGVPVGLEVGIDGPAGGPLAWALPAAGGAGSTGAEGAARRDDPAETEDGEPSSDLGSASFGEPGGGCPRPNFGVLSMAHPRSRPLAPRVKVYSGIRRGQHVTLSRSRFLDRARRAEGGPGGRRGAGPPSFEIDCAV